MASPNKPSLIKKLLFITLGLGALGALALGLAVLFVDWNALKDKATAYLSQALRHEVKVESVQASIFTGVALNKISVANASGFGSQPLFYAEKAVLRPSLLSILKGKLIISQIEFKNPKVLIQKNAKGVFNFSDMSPSTGSGPSAAKKDGDGKGGRAVMPDMIIASFKLSGGDLTYVDKAARKTTAVKGLDVTLSGFSLKAAGNSRLEIKLTAELEGKKIPLSYVADFKLNLPKDEATLISGKLTLPGVDQETSGSFKGLTSGLVIDVKQKAVIDLAKAIDGLLPPSSAAGLPKGLKASGKLEAESQAKGPVKSLESLDLKASLRFNSIGLKMDDAPTVEDLNGELSISPTRAKLPALNAKIGGSPVSVKLDVWDYSLKGLTGDPSKMRAKVKLEISSPKLGLEPLIAFAMLPDPPEVEKAKTAANVKSGGIKDFRSTIPRGLSVEIKVNADALAYKSIVTGALAHHTVLAGQKLKSQTNLKLFDGEFWERTNLDFSAPGPGYGFSIGLSKMKLENFVNAYAGSVPGSKAMAQLKDKVFGSLSFKAQGRGRGFKAPALTKNLEMNGQFQLMDGALKKLEVQEKLASAIPHPATAEAIRRDIDFDQAMGDFSLKNSTFNLSQFTLSSGQDHRAGNTLIQAKGTMVLEGPVDFRVTPHFNPSIVKLDGALAQGFNDDAGWATYDSLGYAGPDLDRAKADYKAGARKAVTKILNKQVEDAKKKAQDEGKKALEEKGKDLMKNLFGR